MQPTTRFLLLFFSLIALAPITVNSQSSDIQYAECPTMDYIDMQTGQKIDPIYSPAALCATIDGFTYEIIDQKWSDYPTLWVRKIIDLDMDGWDEALVQLGTGGNGCCWEHYIVSYRGNGFFTTDTNKFLSRAHDFHVKIYNGVRLLQAIDRGSDSNASFTEEMNEYAFEFGKLVLRSSLRNIASIQIETAITSANVSQERNSLLNAFIDDDEAQDTVECEVWGRYNLLSCEMFIAGKRSYALPSNCEIIAISANSTNGMKDIICNLNQGYKFNGKDAYEFAPPPN